MRNALAGISALGLLGFAALPVSAHEASQVHSDLRQRGYYDVQFVVAEPPFQVEACLEGQRFHLHVDFYGRVTERSPAGPCRRQWGDRRYDDRTYGEDRYRR